ncbi:hypothetical protein N7493_003473 [Penicillium malachiteum]|uniref:Aminoglycoside phosphotransferase domain-containing protein n=1 Tax=Penicillium malachiteum TaxID=1324776 RepID=A0AAD6MXJ4_9EURO|nr:hypothetical protein N7493_003473 [Penicillium malachiteum]
MTEDLKVTLPLLRGKITLQSALEEEDDILLEQGYPEQRIDFFLSLWSDRDGIEKIASYHLGLNPSQTCQIGSFAEWVHGSFDVCIPLYVSKQGQQAREKRAMIRFPLPYKLGESRNPGNVDEKLRSEAATFIWMREHCPEVPIPQLWGFGRVGGYPLPCPYVSHQRSILIESGYLIMDFIGQSESEEPVEMLSETWDKHRDQQEKRENLFKGLSHIILSMSQTPLPRIGSWTLDSNGVLKLSNRPLTLRLHQLENAGIPTNINRSTTYTGTESYYLDFLSCHDSRIRNQPNSITDADDGRIQMVRLMMMKALLPHFCNKEYRTGPFFYRLTDLHPSNIFVDNQWNVKFIIDLEWACSLLAETLRPPYWLTGLAVDGLTDEHLQAFEERYEEFMNIFEKEEKRLPPINNDDSYEKYVANWNPKGLYNLFSEHICPIFTQPRQFDPESDSSKSLQLISDFWAPGAEELTAAKLKDKEYEESISELFSKASSSKDD